MNVIDESVVDVTLKFSRKYFVQETGSDGRANNFGAGGTKSVSLVLTMGTMVCIDAVEESVSVDVSVVSSCTSSFNDVVGRGCGNFANRAFRKSLGCSIKSS